MDKDTGSAVTLEAFADRVGCHFTTASRLRNGQRMPGRELLGTIVREYDLDQNEVFAIYTREDPEEFGAYLRDKIFEKSVEDESDENEEEEAVADGAE